MKHSAKLNNALAVTRAGSKLHSDILQIAHYLRAHYESRWARA